METKTLYDLRYVRFSRCTRTEVSPERFYATPLSYRVWKLDRKRSNQRGYTPLMLISGPCEDRTEAESTGRVVLTKHCRGLAGAADRWRALRLLSHRALAANHVEAILKAGPQTPTSWGAAKGC
jgi:hypothetical protein